MPYISYNDRTTETPSKLKRLSMKLATQLRPLPRSRNSWILLPRLLYAFLMRTFTRTTSSSTVIIYISKRNKLTFDGRYSLHNRAAWCRGRGVEGKGSSVRISAGTLSVLTEVFRSFPSSFQANAGIVPSLCPDSSAILQVDVI
jgi:hypothetical protein